MVVAFYSALRFIFRHDIFSVYLKALFSFSSLRSIVYLLYASLYLFVILGLHDSSQTLPLPSCAFVILGLPLAVLYLSRLLCANFVLHRMQHRYMTFPKRKLLVCIVSNGKFNITTATTPLFIPMSHTKKR